MRLICGSIWSLTREFLRVKELDSGLRGSEPRMNLEPQIRIRYLWVEPPKDPEPP